MTKANQGEIYILGSNAPPGPGCNPGPIHKYPISAQKVSRLKSCFPNSANEDEFVRNTQTWGYPPEVMRLFYQKHLPAFDVKLRQQNRTNTINSIQPAPSGQHPIPRQQEPQFKTNNKFVYKKDEIFGLYMPTDIEDKTPLQFNVKYMEDFQLYAKENFDSIEQTYEKKISFWKKFSKDQKSDLIYFAQSGKILTPFFAKSIGLNNIEELQEAIDELKRVSIEINRNFADRFMKKLTMKEKATLKKAFKKWPDQIEEFLHETRSMELSTTLKTHIHNRENIARIMNIGTSGEEEVENEIESAQNQNEVGGSQSSNSIELLIEQASGSTLTAQVPSSSEPMTSNRSCSKSLKTSTVTLGQVVPNTRLSRKRPLVSETQIANIRKNIDKKFDKDMSKFINGRNGETIKTLRKEFQYWKKPLYVFKEFASVPTPSNVEIGAEYIQWFCDKRGISIDEAKKFLKFKMSIEEDLRKEFIDIKYNEITVDQIGCLEEAFCKCNFDIDKFMKEVSSIKLSTQLISHFYTVTDELLQSVTVPGTEESSKKRYLENSMIRHCIDDKFDEDMRQYMEGKNDKTLKVLQRKLNNWNIDWEAHKNDILEPILSVGTGMSEHIQRIMRNLDIPLSAAQYLVNMKANIDEKRRNDFIKENFDKITVEQNRELENAFDKCNLDLDKFKKHVLHMKLSIQVIDHFFHVRNKQRNQVKMPRGNEDAEPSRIIQRAAENSEPNYVDRHDEFPARNQMYSSNIDDFRFHIPRGENSPDHTESSRATTSSPISDKEASSALEEEARSEPPRKIARHEDAHNDIPAEQVNSPGLSQPEENEMMGEMNLDLEQNDNHPDRGVEFDNPTTPEERMEVDEIPVLQINEAKGSKYSRLGKVRRKQLVDEWYESKSNESVGKKDCLPKPIEAKIQNSSTSDHRNSPAEQHSASELSQSQEIAETQRKINDIDEVFVDSEPESESSDHYQSEEHHLQDQEKLENPTELEQPMNETSTVNENENEAINDGPVETPEEVHAMEFERPIDELSALQKNINEAINDTPVKAANQPERQELHFMEIEQPVDEPSAIQENENGVLNVDPLEEVQNTEENDAMEDMLMEDVDDDAGNRLPDRREFENPTESEQPVNEPSTLHAIGDEVVNDPLEAPNRLDSKESHLTEFEQPVNQPSALHGNANGGINNDSFEEVPNRLEREKSNPMEFEKPIDEPSALHAIENEVINDAPIDAPNRQEREESPEIIYMGSDAYTGPDPRPAPSIPESQRKPRLVPESILTRIPDGATEEWELWTREQVLQWSSLFLDTEGQRFYMKKKNFTGLSMAEFLDKKDWNDFDSRSPINGIYISLRANLNRIINHRNGWTFD